MEISILIITFISLVLFVIVYWDNLYAHSFPMKFKKSKVLKDFAEVKAIWDSNLELYRPYYPGQHISLETSQEIVKKLSAAFTKWLTDYNIETDQPFESIVVHCNQVKDKMRNIALPVRKQGAIDSDSLQKAIEEITESLNFVESELTKSNIYYQGLLSAIESRLQDLIKHNK